MRTDAVPVIALTVLFGIGALAQQAPQTPPAAQGQQAQAPRRAASPAGTAATQVGGQWTQDKPEATPRYTGGKWLEVTYGRPVLRGRKDIFGAGADYGKTVNAGAPVWRAGANQTTRFMTEVPLVFAGKTLPAGEYSVFVKLEPNNWTLIFSKQPYQQKYDTNEKTATWGSDNYNQANDVLRVPMTAGTSTSSVEQFTIGFVDMTRAGGKLAMWWEKTVATVPFTVGS